MTDTQDWTFVDFAAGTTPLPEPNLSWNTYGTGIEGIGRDGEPEAAEIPAPAADQLLIRVDAVGLCFSDVKLIKQGGDHPKLYGRDLSVEPTRLGHEVSVTVVEVGTDLTDTYAAGQRLAIQPDIHVDGKSTAYGYTIPGGLIQYHLIGPEVLDADDGAYVIPVDDVGYAAAALSEPWACVEASYTQRRRLEPLAGGTMWIIGNPDDTREYEFSSGLDAPARIFTTDVTSQTSALVESMRNSDADVIERNGLSASEFAAFSEEVTNGDGFDDIVILDAHDADVVEEAAKLIAFRGTMAMVGTRELDRYPLVDVGRIHYHYTALLGTSGSDVSASYGEARNRADVVAGGTTVFVGAAGPMGQMHMQRALEKPDGPQTLIGFDLDDDRIEAAKVMLEPLAEQNGRTLVFINPEGDNDVASKRVDELTDGNGADDVVVTVPVGPVMAHAGTMMSADGMLVLFAGVPNGTMAPLNLSDVYLHNAQFTGTSGSSIEDQASVLTKAVEGSLSPGLALAAVGGIEAAQDGVRALLEGHYAGKVVIFPQLSGLDLQSLEQLAADDSEIAGALGPNNTWTEEAERLLFEKFHAG